MTIHLPSETAMALAMVMNDPRIDLMLKRHAAEQAIEDLIQFLDDIEGDSDFEPSLGFGGAGDDREGGDVQDEPHDEMDEDGRDVSWPEAGPRALGSAHGTEDDEDTHDAEATNEEGGNILDEPHDAEEDCCAADEMGTGYGGISWEAKKAIDAECRELLSRVPQRSQVQTAQTIVGPDGRIYTMDWS
jgi:hypothetical protein